MAYLLRIVLPDRPGSLGTLAMSLGSARIDIVSVDVVERNPGGAVDDIVVELPPGSQPDLALVAAQRVPGVSVVSLQPYPSGLDIHRELVLMEELATDPCNAVDHLAHHAPEVFHAGWAVVAVADPVRLARAVAGSTAAPEVLVREGAAEIPWLALDKPCALDLDEAWAPPSWVSLETEVAAAPLGDSGLVVLVGRQGGPPYLSSEILRLGHLASITGMVHRTAGEG